MKKIFIFFIILLINNVFLSEVNANSSDKETYFIVTAYYSPLANQENYSYSVYNKRQRTYIEEMRLQWKWTHWASWKKVFVWMLAWPKNYKFWTKIYLEWLWIWEIADRWQAIVNKGKRGYKYDRIDVWMWYGDEWLKRATNWWKRKVRWKILDKNIKISLNYDHIKTNSIWNNRENTLTKKEKRKKIIDIFRKKIEKSNEIKELQRVLKELEYYNWELTWKYDDVVDAVYSFQLSKEIVKSEYSPWAWNFWPITRKKLEKTYNDFLLNREKERLRIIKINEEKKKEKQRLEKLVKKYNELKQLAQIKAIEKVDYIWNVKFWDVSIWVRELQKSLKLLWFFDHKDTAIYWNITRDSIISYQIDRKIIKSKYDIWAWVVWPKTRNALKNDLFNIELNILVKNENMNLNEVLAFSDNSKKSSS